MRMGILAVAVIAVLVILLMMFTNYLETTVKTIISHINETEKYFAANDYESSKKSFFRAKEIWHTKEKIYKLQIEHSELDKINELFTKMEAYFKNKGNDEFLKDAHTLKYFLTNLILKNKVNLETVL